MSKPMVAQFKKNDYAQGYITYAQKAGELLEYYERKASRGILMQASTGLL